MPIRLKASSQRIRRRRPKKEVSNSPISAASSFANLEEQNYTRLYNDITNPLEIMKCRHPLETGLTKEDIFNPNNDRFNRNILKKICISDNDFDHLCESPNTSSKYKNLLLTPIQKAMTYCMIHDGGRTSDEAILAFILRFWKSISTYNNSDTPGSTGQEYKKPPTKRILHINYTIVRDGMPLFINYGEGEWGPNTIDGIRIGTGNSRISSKESILKINNYSQKLKDEASDKSKNNDNAQKRGKRRSSQNNESSSSKPINSNDSRSSKSSNSDSTKKSNGRSSSAKDDIRKSGTDEPKPNQRESRNQKANKSQSNGNSDNDLDKTRLNDQNSNDINSNSSRKGKRSNNNENVRRSSSVIQSSPNSGYSSFSTLNSTRNKRLPKRSFLINESNFWSENGENFQNLLLKAMKNDSRNESGGMTVNEIIQACQSFRYAPGVYYELPLDKRVKSVLFMKKQLKEVDLNESNGTWFVAPDKQKKWNIKEYTKRIQKVLNDKENQSKNDDNNNNGSPQNDFETDNDQKDEDLTEEKNTYMPEKLKILNMKELTIYDLWNIVNDVGLY